jgi:hypothetical protein
MRGHPIEARVAAARSGHRASFAVTRCARRQQSRAAAISGAAAGTPKFARTPRVMLQLVRRAWALPDLRERAVTVFFGKIRARSDAAEVQHAGIIPITLRPTGHVEAQTAIFIVIGAAVGLPLGAGFE